MFSLSVSLNLNLFMINQKNFIMYKKSESLVAINLCFFNHQIGRGIGRRPCAKTCKLKEKYIQLTTKKM